MLQQMGFHQLAAALLHLSLLAPKKDFRYSDGRLKKPKYRNAYLINFGHQAQCNASCYFLFFDSIGDLELQQSQHSSKRRRLRIDCLIYAKHRHRRQHCSRAPKLLKRQCLDDLNQSWRGPQLCFPQNAFQKQSGSVR